MVWAQGDHGPVVWAQGIKDQWSGHRGSRINGLGTGDQGLMVWAQGIKDQWSGHRRSRINVYVRFWWAESASHLVLWHIRVP